MSAHAEEHFAGSNKLFISIWVWLLLFTLIEIGLAYRPMAIHIMLTILLGYSDLRAAASRLIAKANENGGPDNITVVLARWVPG